MTTKRYETIAGREFAFAKLITDGIPYESWAAIKTAASLIIRHARTYKRIQEAWCSVEMNDAETARTQKREANIENRIVMLAKSLPGVEGVVFQGDPRGATIKLVMKDKDKHDCWGREGLCVPHS